MIRAADAAALARFAPSSESLLRILSAARAYGTEQDFCRFCVGEDSALSLMDGAATAHFGADGEDLELFLAMSPDVRTVRTGAEDARRLAVRFGGRVQTGEVVRADSPVLPEGEAATADPAAIWPVLQAVFGDTLPSFDAWYADAHHRWRHGLLHTAAVMRDGRVVSCALTTAECEDAALLGGVATLPDYRGQGLASAVVTALAAARQAAGQRVWISPKNADAARLYRRLGFTVCGEWGIAEK